MQLLESRVLLSSVLIDQVGDWVASLTFDTNNSANGAVLVHQTRGFHPDLPQNGDGRDNGADLFQVRPYFGNLGIIGLLESPYADKLDVAQRAITWYLANIEADGTMLDHWYQADGSLPPTVSPTTPSDADDSSASTALMMIDAYIRAGGDTTFLNTQENRDKIDSIVGVLIHLQQANGLTWAKDSYHVAYTEDNSETYGGFVAAGNIESVLGQRPDKIADYALRAEQVRQGILTDLYDSITGLFLSSDASNTVNLDQWYPDTQHLVWPVLFHVIDPDSPIAMAQFAALDSTWDGTPQADWTTTQIDETGVELAALLEGSSARALAHANNVAARHFSTTPASPIYPFTVGEAGFFLRALTPILNAENIETNEDTSLSGTMVGLDLQGDALTYTVTVQPQHGTLTSFDPQTGAFVYQPTADYFGADSFTAYVSDGSNRSLDQVFTIHVNPVNDPPMIGAFDGTVAYTANGPAVVLDLNATVADTDTTRFTGGVLTVGLTANGEASDLLSFRPVARVLDVSGSDLTFRGTVIGSFTGGAGATNLVVTFNANATASAVQYVLRNLTFRSLSGNPSTAPRTVEVTLSDGAGATSDLSTKQIDITAGLGPAPGLVAVATSGIASGWIDTNLFQTPPPLANLSTLLTLSQWVQVKHEPALVDPAAEIGNARAGNGLHLPEVGNQVGTGNLSADHRHANDPNTRLVEKLRKLSAERALDDVFSDIERWLSAGR